jgi:hypothetical protein
LFLRCRRCYLLPLSRWKTSTSANFSDQVGQPDGAVRIDVRYEGTGGADHQQNSSQDDHQVD